MSTKRIHIAVLDTDVPMPTVYAARGLYSSQFRLLLQRAAERINNNLTPSHSSTTTTDPPDHHHPRLEIHTTAYDVIGGSYPPLQTLRRRTTTESTKNEADDHNRDTVLFPGPVDAILITGSAASAWQTDKYPWIRGLLSFTQTVFRDFPAVKIFGSCFGHQAVAQALLCDEDQGQPDSIDNTDHYGSCGNTVENRKGTTMTKTSVSVGTCPEGYEIGIYPIRMNPVFVDHFPVLRSSLSSPSSCSSASTAGGQEKEEKEMRIQLIHGDRVIADSLLATTTTASPTDPFSPDVLPSPWINIGSTQKSPIQGLYLPDRVLTYQGHFEFDTWMNRETCIEFGRRAGWSADDLESYLEGVSRGRKSTADYKPEDAFDYGDSDDDDAKVAAEVVVMFLAGMASASTSSVAECASEKDTVSLQPTSTEGILFPSPTAQSADHQVQGVATGPAAPTAVLRNGQITPPLKDDRVSRDA